MYYDDFDDIYDPYYYFNYMRQRPRPPFGQPPATPPFGAGPGTQAPPVGRPPSFVPQQQQGPSILAVDPGAIRPCTFQFVYLWLRDGRSFWAYLTFVGPRSVAGFRWARSRWVYFGTDLRNIDNFICY
ncbi:hypothetical protein HNQ80_002345 [Anaerosolibacter carboniphilus]|uniref:Transporter n=1 Tax=Anaerosolibacter carboniphilus TaxID=1417629 RepID=A0A841KRQ9_9FIRM|nr:hypothetical protein [Anaerosolibacter carboniphilus]